MRNVVPGGEIVTAAMQDAPPPSERDLRHRRVRQAMRDASLDGLLAFAPAWRREHFRYLAGAGVRGSFAFVYLPLEGEPVAFVSAPEDAADVAAAGWVTDVRPLAAGELAAALSAARLGVAHLELLPDALRNRLDGVE